ncbi:MAG TPA: T9SS type A sorting domain-containing protein, partial [Ignavibacteria bacterium]|nr:T9SS type A sorting domain-containing protein [Ignavibacteria bacterium]
LRIFLTIFAVMAIFATANSQTLFIENFDYPAGDSIGAHGWIHHSGSVNTIKVVSPGLTYTGYPLSGIGNAARLSNNGNDNYRQFTNVGDSITSGSLYASMMVKVDSVKSTGDYFFDFISPTSTTNFYARVFVKDSLGGLCFGVSKYSINSTIFPAWGSTSFSYTGTYLVVVKYKFNTGSTTDDEVSLFVFESPNFPTTEPTTPYAGPLTTTQNDAGSFGRIQLRQGSASIAPTLVVDGIKIARSWTSLVSSITRNEITAKNFELSQNYPNPFNPVTNIRFALPTNGFATLKVYDILGNEVNTLVNAQMNQGVYTVNMNGTKLSSGTYMCKLTFKSVNGTIYNDIMKMTLLK